MLFAEQSLFLLFFADWSLKPRKPYSPRGTFQSVHSPHVSLYKALGVRTFRDQSATSQTTHKFLSPFSWIKIVTNSERLKNKLTNPNCFRSKLSQNQWSFSVSSQRFNRIIITEPFLCNSSAKSIARSNESGAITEEEIEKKKVKNSKVLNRLRRRKKGHGLFPDFSLKGA